MFKYINKVQKIIMNLLEKKIDQVELQSIIKITELEKIIEQLNQRMLTKIQIQAHQVNIMLNLLILDIISKSYSCFQNLNKSLEISENKKIVVYTSYCDRIKKPKRNNSFGKCFK